MQTIVPNIWFDSNAEEAAKFYVSVFGGELGRTMRYDAEGAKVSGQKEGTIMTAEWTIGDCAFVGINGGPIFKPNPSISFMLNYDPSVTKDAREKLDAAWKQLEKGGNILMPLDAYPFSEHYGWVQDKYGVSWQLILTKPEGEKRPFVIPSLMLTGDMTGKAGEAIDFYVSLFKNAKRGMAAPYPEGAAPEKSAKIMFAEFMLENQWFTAMDSGHMHTFGFNEAVSLMVNCDTQEEIDRLWKAMSAHKGSEQCGWLKDKYGVSWQITPRMLDDMFRDENTKKAGAAMKAMLGMHKLDIAKLQEAYDNA